MGSRYVYALWPLNREDTDKCTLTITCFIVFQICYMGIVLFGPAIALEAGSYHHYLCLTNGDTRSLTLSTQA